MKCVKMELFGAKSGEKRDENLPALCFPFGPHLPQALASLGVFLRIGQFPYDWSCDVVPVTHVRSLWSDQIVLAGPIFNDIYDHLRYAFLELVIWRPKTRDITEVSESVKAIYSILLSWMVSSKQILCALLRRKAILRWQPPAWPSKIVIIADEADRLRLGDLAESAHARILKPSGV